MVTNVIEVINDAVRMAMDRFVGVAAALYGCGMNWRVRTYVPNQSKLRRMYAITDDVPIRGYNLEVERSIENRYRQMKAGMYAYTSGSTKKPKRIAFDRRRVGRTRWVFVGTMFRNLCEVSSRNRTFFAFVPMRSESSLTSMISEEGGSPSYVRGLFAPHSLQCDPSVRHAADLYGEVAVRLWLMTISNPTLIYATNPSSLATFFHNLESNWPNVRRLAASPGNLRHIQRRILSKGAGTRLRRIAISETPLSIQQMFPKLKGFSCWDGGYVRPFIDQIRTYLPEDRYRFIPMYSMSTETIETVTHKVRDANCFLPIAPGVLYEFIESGYDDRFENLLQSRELKVGKRYAMVVSDAYGLRRYQTDDVFECAGFVSAVPDLRFIQRRNLSYSFTGEKLTGDQLKLVYAEVHKHFPALQSEGFLTCFPSHPHREVLPCYRLVFVATSNSVRLARQEVATFVQQKLEAINHEFRAKVRSGRLGAMKLEVVGLSDFVSSAPSESQFKVLPLYTRLWEART